MTKSFTLLWYKPQTHFVNWKKLVSSAEWSMLLVTWRDTGSVASFSPTVQKHANFQIAGPTRHCIVGNFRGRKLLRILWFCGYLREFSPWKILGRGCSLAQQKQAIYKSFLSKSCIFHQLAKVFSPKVFCYKAGLPEAIRGWSGPVRWSLVKLVIFCAQSERQNFGPSYFQR